MGSVHRQCTCIGTDNLSIQHIGNLQLAKMGEFGNTLEEVFVDGQLITTYSVKVSTYLHGHTQKGIAMIGRPALQYYFDRPLHVLFNACFNAGLVLDGLEEPAFHHPHDGSWSRSNRSLSWVNYSEIPPYW